MLYKHRFDLQLVKEQWLFELKNGMDEVKVISHYQLEFFNTDSV
jgi:hypothetical protein